MMLGVLNRARFEALRTHVAKVPRTKITEVPCFRRTVGLNDRLNFSRSFEI